MRRPSYVRRRTQPHGVGVLTRRAKDSLAETHRARARGPWIALEAEVRALANLVSGFHISHLRYGIVVERQDLYQPRRRLVEAAAR